jgi:hypothetical protein
MRRFFWVFLFGLTLAYDESAIEVYLREIFYPEGFGFPLHLEISRIAFIELGREACTLVMLAAVGFMAGRTRWERIAFFLFAFGIWDIFYYVWLKVFLNWPPSLLTWDLLFLVPVPWCAPCLAPIIVAISMAAAGLLLVRHELRGHTIRMTPLDILLITLAGLLTFISFILDFRLVVNNGVPDFYHWEILIFSELIGIFVLLRVIHVIRPRRAA